MWTHAPYINDKFGPPPSIVKNLVGRYHDMASMKTVHNSDPNPLSHTKFHKQTSEEVLVHARINHLLRMYLCFPNCHVSEFSLRHTGNRGLEAIHGMFRGGTSSLPITISKS